MKKKLILAALLMSMAVTVFADEQIVWEETAVENAALAESVFEEETVSGDDVSEETASEEPEYVFEEPETIEEENTDEESVFEEIAFEENADQSTDLIQEESVFEEDSISEEMVTEEVSAGEESSVETSVAASGLVYTGEPQELIMRQEGTWFYSLDGETFTPDIPTGVNAGEYTVYMKEGEEVVTVKVSIAKADVTFTPPVPNTTEELSNTQLE